MDGDEARHLAKVRRVPVGASIEIFDGEGNAWIAKVDRIERASVFLVVENRIETVCTSRFRIILATAFPKGDRVDWLVEKATELGVERIIPLLSTRSVVDPRLAKIDRLRRTVIEASKQCGRSRLMTIEPPRTWSDLAISRPSTQIRLLAHPDGDALPTLPSFDAGSNIVLAIGPEGGFTQDEVELGKREGWAMIGLGSTLLRVETAALAGVCAILFQK